MKIKGACQGARSPAKSFMGDFGDDFGPSWIYTTELVIMATSVLLELDART